MLLIILFWSWIAITGKWGWGHLGITLDIIGALLLVKGYFDQVIIENAGWGNARFDRVVRAVASAGRARIWGVGFLVAGFLLQGIGNVLDQPHSLPYPIWRIQDWIPVGNFLNWSVVGVLAAIIVAFGSIGTLFAILWQVHSAKREARGARTINYLTRYNNSLGEVRKARKFDLPPAFEPHDHVTFGLAINLLQVTTELAVAYEADILDRELVENTLVHSYDWLSRIHGSVPKKMHVSEGRFSEVAKILNIIKPGRT